MTDRPVNRHSTKIEGVDQQAVYSYKGASMSVQLVPGVSHPVQQFNARVLHLAFNF